MGTPSNKLKPEKVIESFVAIWKDTYDYSRVIYKDNLTKVEIVCKVHGSFWATPKDHKRDNPSGKATGCPRCYGTNHKFGLERFLERARAVHGSKFDYSKSIYLGFHKPLEIVCNKHGHSFFPTPANHLNGTGCPLCRQSKGESRISLVLDSLNIKYEREKSFPGLRGLKKYRFDFFIPEYNCLIEYHGRQHYEPGSWPGAEGLKKIQKRDDIKRKWARENGFSLIEIGYWDYGDIKQAILDRTASVIL